MKRKIPADFTIKQALVDVFEDTLMVTEAAAKIVTGVVDFIDYGKSLGFKNIAMANFVSGAIFEMRNEFGLEGIKGMNDKQILSYLLGHFVILVESHIRKNARTAPEQAVQWMHGKLKARAMSAEIELEEFVKLAGIETPKQEFTESATLDAETIALLERTFRRENERCKCGLDGMLTLQKTGMAIKVYHEQTATGGIAYHNVRPLSQEQFKEAKQLEKQFKNRQKVAQKTANKEIPAVPIESK